MNYGPAILISIILAIGFGVDTVQTRQALVIHCTSLQNAAGADTNSEDYRNAKSICAGVGVNL